MLPYISDYCIISCGYTQRLIEDITRDKDSEFKNCLYINYRIYKHPSSEDKTCIIHESDGEAKFVMDAMNEIQISGSRDFVAFKNPANLEELMGLNHCGCFGHYELYKVQYIEYLEKRIVVLIYDTESGWRQPIVTKLLLKCVGYKTFFRFPLSREK